MTDLLSPSTVNRPVSLSSETAPLSLSDRTKHIDRGMHLLADRRHRFYLYYLYRANEPLSIRELAMLVEASLCPSEEPITERIIEESVRSFVDTHLPKLRDAGLVRVRDGQVSLPSNPAFPIRAWLSVTAEVELER